MGVCCFMVVFFCRSGYFGFCVVRVGCYFLGCMFVVWVGVW